MSEQNENNQDQLYLKQELLKSEIIAKNYDGQKFLEYCINLKENGDDMNNWTYDELKSVVLNFIASTDHSAAKEEKKKEIKKEQKKEIKEAAASEGCSEDTLKELKQVRRILFNIDLI